MRLLDRTRAALKSKPRIDMQRREIAIFAGVTPALVSYYFPDKWDLFAAAARPVVVAYIEEMRGALRKDSAPRLKVLCLVTILIDFNFHYGYLLDFYIENSERMARKDDLQALRDTHDAMLTFFEQLIQSGLVRAESPAFMQSCLWGLCKYVTQHPDLLAGVGEAEKEHALRGMAENVCSLFLNGAATHQFSHDMDRGEGQHPSLSMA